GVKRFRHRRRTPASISGAATPTANDRPPPTCTATGQTGCLLPCPVCGNGVVEFPETCDNNVGTPQSCDGCSAFCQVENCTDTNVCTTDSCDPTLGCRHQAVPAGTSCDDGNACTGTEGCAGSICTHQSAPDVDDTNTYTPDSY